MRNFIFRVLAGLLGFGSLLAIYDAIVNFNLMLFVYLFFGALCLIFAFGGYKGTDWADYYINRAADKISDLFGKKYNLCFMNKEACRLHVLKRFHAFEWVIFIISLNYLVIHFKFAKNEFFSFLTIGSIVFLVLINGLFFSAKNHSNVLGDDALKLIRRRYFDLVIYIFLISVLISVYALYFIAAWLPIIVISILSSNYGWFVGVISFLVIALIPVSLLLLRHDVNGPFFNKFSWIDSLFNFPFLSLEFLKRKIDSIHILNPDVN